MHRPPKPLLRLKTGTKMGGMKKHIRMKAVADDGKHHASLAEDSWYHGKRYLSPGVREWPVTSSEHEDGPDGAQAGRDAHQQLHV